LVHALAEISNEWECIGLALEVPQDDLDSIKRNEPNDRLRLSKMLQAWMDMSINVTWETIVEAVQGPIVKKKLHANKILNEYVSRPDIL
jgi:hypothetical protein